MINNRNNWYKLNKTTGRCLSLYWPMKQGSFVQSSGFLFVSLAYNVKLGRTIEREVKLQEMKLWL